MASEQSSSGPTLNDMTPRIISSGLVRTSSSSTSYVPPLRNDWDLLFQPMFDELLNPSPSVVNQAPEVIAPIAKDLLFQPMFDELLNPPPSVDPQAPAFIASIVDVIPPVQAESTGSPSSTIVDQDAPSPSKLQPKADIRIFISYAPTKKAFRIYNRRSRRIVETIHVDFDELTAMASEQSSSGPTLNDMTPRIISSGLVRTSSSSTSYVPPLRNDWDLLFQPMFDELLNPSPSVVNQAPEVIAPICKVIPQVDADSTGSPSSTTVDQDAPSPSKSLTTTEIQSSVIPQDVGDDNLDMEVAHMGNDPLLGVPIPEVISA
nr:hypothetical protein [Tanacetum cinerariifolium]